MMNVEADQELCCASARCVELAPDVFEQDDDGLVVVLIGQPCDELRDAVASAVRQCPTRAIEVNE